MEAAAEEEARREHRQALLWYRAAGAAFAGGDHASEVVNQLQAVAYPEPTTNGYTEREITDFAGLTGRPVDEVRAHVARGGAIPHMRRR